MISTEHVRTMTAYNSWQNHSLYSAANKLSDHDRKQQRGAFFGSIHGTFNHLLWGDMLWISRFTETNPPTVTNMGDTTELHTNWSELRDAREEFDQSMFQWANNIEENWLQCELTWKSVALNRSFTNQAWLLVVHMFNHQTHHRGQIHAMLTSAGVQPDNTDLPFMPDTSMQVLDC